MRSSFQYGLSGSTGSWPRGTHTSLDRGDLVTVGHVKDEQVVACRRRPGAPFRVGRELEVHVLAREPEHDAAVARMVVEGVDAPQAKALLVEGQNVLELVGRPGEADGGERAG